MRKAVVTLIFFMAYITSFAAPQPLSAKAEISMLTCCPSGPIYARFGHTALQVTDTTQNIDYVFHWGLFNFDSPNFILRFMLGKTDYEMGVFSTKYFLRGYEERGSSVYAQTLDLTHEQKNELWNQLWENYKPENRIYRYNFVFDNCATRPYNAIKNCYGADFIPYSSVKYITYRNIINEHVNKALWINTGINIIIGSRADKPISTQAMMAFPLYTHEYLKYCTHRDCNEKASPVVKKETPLINIQQNDIPDYLLWLSYLTQILLPVLVTVLMMTYYLNHHHTFCPYVTQSLFIVYGTISLIIMFLWFLSSHPLVQDNYNLLWFNPINLILGISLCFDRRHMFTLYLSFATLIPTLLFPIAVLFKLQEPTLTLMLLWLTHTFNCFITTSTLLKTVTNKRNRLS